MTPKEEKKNLRKTCLQERLALTQEEQGEYNRAICDLFFKHIPLGELKCINTFLPMMAKAEPNTYLIVERLQREFPNIQVTVPKMIASSNSLEVIHYNPTHLHRNPWGVDEPTKGIAIPPTMIDLIIVPLLAYDQQGTRLGYGGGFYDRFLPQCRTDCVRVGLSFFPPLKYLPAEKWDLPLHQGICPEGVYRFSKGD